MFSYYVKAYTCQAIFVFSCTHYVVAVVIKHIIIIIIIITFVSCE